MGEAENSQVRESRSTEFARDGAVVGREMGPISVAELRAALDDAIRARAWPAVEAINVRLCEVERADVIDLNAARAMRDDRRR